ncbi:MAG: ribosome biogenesis GTPase Der [Patescibacteria group bacterium]|nr:ribosome biogenesis GTPase Der [Patescibacteria group bacterium]
MKRIGIIGRTNVGKSTLFNRLIKKSRSITSSIAGTTRDYVSGELDLDGNISELIDFGGFDFNTAEVIEKNVQSSILKNLDRLDLIIFVVDGKVVIGDEEKRIAELLRKSKKPVILVVNKVEKESEKNNIYDFYALGFSDVVAISAIANLDIGELIELIQKKLKFRKNKSIKSTTEKTTKIAIIGKPNVGKSSLFNTLYGSERSIVTTIAGTTRDSIDEKIKIGKKDYLFIDTAGLRRKTKIYEKLDKESSHKSIESINRADIVLYLLDVSSLVSSYDIKLINYAWKKGKSILVVVNKWDLKSPDMTEKKYQELITIDYSIFKKFPFVFISAIQEKGIERMLEEIKRLENISSIAIKTSLLNNMIRKIILDMGFIDLKVFYAVQTGKNPVEIVIFVNNKKYFKPKYIEYIEGQLRLRLNLLGVPISIILRDRER